jgi:hypothetical protein
MFWKTMFPKYQCHDVSLICQWQRPQFIK